MWVKESHETYSVEWWKTGNVKNYLDNNGLTPKEGVLLSEENCKSNTTQLHTQRPK